MKNPPNFETSPERKDTSQPHAVGDVAQLLLWSKKYLHWLQGEMEQSDQPHALQAMLGGFLIEMAKKQQALADSKKHLLVKDTDSDSLETVTLHGSAGTVTPLGNDFDLPHCAAQYVLPDGMGGVVYVTEYGNAWMDIEPTHAIFEGGEECNDALVGGSSWEDEDEE